MTRLATTSVLPCLFLLLASLGPSASAQNSPAPEFTPIADAQALYAKYRDRVVQVRILEAGSGSKAAIGSGFAVSDELLISNYHVVANLIHEPKRYRAEYEAEGEQRGKVVVVATDVVHDLALLKATDLKTAPFDLRAEQPTKGERLYSLGNPYDLGMTIVEGSYSGLLQKSLYQKIHFTGSLNPGMSGGPTIDAAGHVVGVNVSGAGDQVSFLVPVEYVRELINDGKRTEELQDELSEDLIRNQQAYLGALLEQPFETIELGGYSFPGQLADYFKCWGDRIDDEDARYTELIHQCSLDDSIYLTSQLRTGGIGFRHSWIENEDLDQVRFWSIVEARTGHFDFSMSNDAMTHFVCDVGLIDQSGTTIKTKLCLRQYKKLGELYDVWLQAVSLADNDRALVTEAQLAGATLANAMAFAERYLSTIQRL